MCAEHTTGGGGEKRKRYRRRRRRGAFLLAPVYFKICLALKRAIISNLKANEHEQC